MARNQEKQLGRLNRLWLEKERQDGHLKDTHRNRPKLSTLNSATEVKKWIPSIKKEIEYFLEQSQLPHYSERKIEEFEEHIEKLRKDYQSHLWKLRRLDPSSKEHPWKPRGYTRKRPTDNLTVGSDPDPKSIKLLRTPVLLSELKHDTGLDQRSNQKEDELNFRLPEANSSSALISCTSVDQDAQDKPLNFSNKMNPKYLWANSPYSTLGEDVLKMKGILLSPHQPLPLKLAIDTSQSQEVQITEATGNVKNLPGLDCYSASSSSSDDDDEA
ncbi:hypothetical protein NDU88_002324 [Pleurodeles waltl]|uniref:Uncharacterized protein n=1 Tax=Pleurodeles waltl TaxID=8319 RepID=A0AAV7T369_PLEWA|nr:hypothetical protein NDU88_002324 [Pleurodeles waltl]